MIADQLERSLGGRGGFGSWGWGLCRLVCQEADWLGLWGGACVVLTVHG